MFVTPVLALLFDDGGVRLLLTASVGFVALVLASRNSTYLIDFFMVVTCFNRFVRRVLDWSEGEYDPTPLLSLTPILVGLIAAMAVAARFGSLPTRAQLAAKYIAAALAYGTIMGMGNAFAAIYSLTQYLMPFGILFYAILVRPTAGVVDRWIWTLGGLGVAVAAYGIFQWAVVPPWDAAWLNWSGMTSSMGKPIPFKMSICSTLESRGPFAWFMATAAIPMCCAPRWRRTWGLAGTGLVILAALLSTARSSWGFLVLAMVFFALLRGKQSLGRVLLAAGTLLATLWFALPLLPESQRIVSRMESLTEITSDGSFQGRIDIAQQGLGMVLTQPQGFGLGATGVGAGRLGGSAVIGDNGYLALLADLGIPGFLLLALGLRRMVRDVSAINQYTSNDLATLGLSMFASGLVFLVIGNWLNSPYAAMMFMILGGTIGAHARQQLTVPRGQTKPWSLAQARPVHWPREL